jgi:two-component system cell cycle sensor histidine kinase/response regulator CckA
MARLNVRKEEQDEIMLSSSYRILLMEGDSKLAQRICGMVPSGKEPEFEVVWVKSLQAAASKLAGEKFDVLLLGLPVRGSRKAAGLIELRSRRGSLPTVVLVPRKEERLGKQLVKEGATEYLQKESIDWESLRIALRSALEREQAESAVRRCEQRFQDLFENTEDILFTLDLDGNITAMNRSGEEVLGLSRSDALQRNIKSFVAPEHQAACREMMQRVLNDQPLQHFEINLIGKDGGKVIFEVSARLIQSGGKKEGIQGIARDVTERRHLESIARQSQKFEAIGRLSGGLAHDFNNLLCVIGGHAEVLSERLDPTDPIINHVNQIKKATDSAATLTRQLLAFSSKQVIHPRTLDLNSVIVETGKLLGRLIGEDIEFVTALDPALGHVRADPVQVEQVLMNLVLNARDAMPQGGRLKIETSNVTLDEKQKSKHSYVPAGNYVQLSVTDTGFGMTEETLGRIFEPFYTTKELGKGTGLGLATVYGIIKQSRGFIWVYSEFGHGATFKIYLPRVDTPLTPLRPSKPLKGTQTGTETVLLVEDAEPLRTLTKEIMERSGYTVLEAGNGIEAIQVANNFTGTIDLLLTDVIMPNMGGEQLAAELLRIRPNLKVLYMSGYPNAGMAWSGTLASAVVLLEKPFSREILMRRLRQALDEQGEDASD